jgi:hypothetical protein
MTTIPTSSTPLNLPDETDLPPYAAAKLRRMDPTLRATILPTEPETGTP